jgi:hypothetical protein
MSYGPGLYRTETHAAAGSTRTRAHTHAHTHINTRLDYNKRKMRSLGLSKILRFSSLRDFDQMCVESKMRN